MISFTDIVNKIHYVKDIILFDVDYNNCNKEAIVEFNRRLYCTKCWYVVASWVNKRYFILTLVEDVQSIWALSLVLKSIWNCRPKDAVQSSCSIEPSSSYDRVPLDHNRTAQPRSTLVQAMSKDRKWFATLEPDFQALLLCELLSVSGGPIVIQVFLKAQGLFQQYQERKQAKLQSLFSSGFTVQTPKTKEKPAMNLPPAPEYPEALDGTEIPVGILRELDIQRDNWQETIRSYTHGLKLNEIEILSPSDNTPIKIWSLERPNPDHLETLGWVPCLKYIVDVLVHAALYSGELNKAARSIVQNCVIRFALKSNFMTWVYVKL